MSSDSGDRGNRVGNFPIGIDAAGFARQATSAEVEERVRSDPGRYEGRQMVLGVDRLDYTKGIPERLRAFANLLGALPGDAWRRSACSRWWSPAGWRSPSTRS